MRKHVVFGAGLIGCFVGGVVASLGFHVSLVCRDTIRDKLSKGLTLTDFKQNKRKVSDLHFINGRDYLSAAPSSFDVDVLWLTVKCVSVEQAVKEITPFVSDNTIILCCQNGLGSDGLVREAFPNNQILRVMVPFNVAEPSPGHLHRGSDGTLTIETSAETSDWFISLIEQLDTPIMPVASTQSMEALLWAKLQLNLGNSINGLADIPVKEMLQQREYRIVIAKMMKELLTVTDAKSLNLPKVTALTAHLIPKVLVLPNVLFKLVANKMLAIDPTVRTSMWWDLSLGKKTEIDYLNGAIIQHAAPLNIDCPVNRKVIELIKHAESLNESGQPREAITAKDLLRRVKINP